MRRFLSYCLIALLVAVPAFSQELPKREFRGAWIQTVFQDEYAQMTPVEMQRDFIRKLDFLKKCGINAIIFQVRPEADAWYASKYEPWSRFLTGKQGKAPSPIFKYFAARPQTHYIQVWYKYYTL